jgi:hypothetical protein
MAVLIDALRTTLEADATFTGYMTGGVYDASELGKDGSLPVSVFDSRGRMQPAVIIRWRGATPGTISKFTEQRYAELWFYADGQTGRVAIENGKARAKVLLHEQLLSSVTGTGGNRLEWVGDQGEFSAEEYQNAAADMSRYRVVYSVTARKT